MRKAGGRGLGIISCCNWNIFYIRNRRLLFTFQNIHDFWLNLCFLTIFRYLETVSPQSASPFQAIQCRLQPLQSPITIILNFPIFCITIVQEFHFFDKNLKFLFLSKFFLFQQKFSLFNKNFPFSTKISLFNKNFPFMTKIFPFYQKFSFFDKIRAGKPI